jgi:hypothetical protein
VPLRDTPPIPPEDETDSALQLALKRLGVGPEDLRIVESLAPEPEEV